DDEEVPRLYTACDCLVHPYRGEGFGLPIAEAMASGRPAIVTGYGAALDFCTDDNAFLVPANQKLFANKRIGDFETVDHPWLAEPDRETLVRQLRFAASHPEEVKAKGRVACAHIREHLTWDHAAAIAEERMLALRQQPIRRFAAQPTPRAVASAPPTTPARVSLCMIVKHEERHLATCLQSVHDLVDEMILVDTGSTDRTKDIAREFGAKVIDFTWQDSFAAARNASLKHATSDWILWLD